MAKYAVTIKATITKTIEVEDAENEQDATEQAHSMFSVLNDGEEENYTEDTMKCVRLG